MSLPKNYIPKKVSVIGAAKSGIAAAKFLVSRGIPVFVSDTCSEEKLVGILGTNGLSSVSHESVEHTDKILDADVIVLSPGVPMALPVIQKAIQQGIAVWSEIELAYRFTEASFLAITGSSGKSTTTSMLGAIVEASGKEYTVAGNIGIPLIEVVPGLSKDALVVAELSSFQLETIDLFRPKVASVINFMKNHLDRYNSEEDYYNAKKEIAKNFSFDNHLVLNAKDDRLVAWAQDMKCKTNVVYFGLPVESHDSVYCENGIIRAAIHGKTIELLAVKDMFLQGPHNFDNASAAAAMAIIAGIDIAAIAKGICSFKGLKHRLEYVAEVNGIRYYNDSKATTAESVLCAVTAFGNNVHVIAGGRDKGCDFSIVKDAVARNARGVYLIGEAADRIAHEWSNTAPTHRCATLEDAVTLATKNAKTGDVVVLSPGCSSFDMFKNYEQRGQTFCDLVLDLERTTS